MFELKINDEVIKLKWGTRAMYLFCQNRNLPLDSFFDAMQEMANDIEMTAVNVQKSFDLVVDMLRAAYESANKKKPDEDDVFDWIDACGGITKINQGQLVGFINYVISVTYTGVTPLPGDKVAEDADDKKKGE